MSFSVRYNQAAVDDLDALRIWIESESDFETAARYLQRVRTRIADLETFSNRGQEQKDLAPGIRTLSFEGRPVIFYTVTDACVDILRVVSTARDLGGIWDG